MTGHWKKRSLNTFWGRDVAQAVEHSAVKVWIPLHGRSILHARSICSLGYFQFQPVVHQRLWHVLSCLCESAYKRSLAGYQKG